MSEEKVFIEVEFPQMQENEEIKMIKRKATFYFYRNAREKEYRLK